MAPPVTGGFPAACGSPDTGTTRELKLALLPGVSLVSVHASSELPALWAGKLRSKKRDGLFEALDDDENDEDEDGKEDDDDEEAS